MFGSTYMTHHVSKDVLRRVFRMCGAVEEIRLHTEEYEPVAFIIYGSARYTERSPVSLRVCLYAYKIKSFQSLLGSAGDKMYLAGVIGIVTGVSQVVKDVRPLSELSALPTQGRQQQWLYGARMLKLIDISSREPVVALIMGCTYKKQNSMLELSASYGSQICINVEIPEIIGLCDMFLLSSSLASFSSWLTENWFT
ncbi:hypothetical protein ACUV84_015299 [Puccinellia chinampoensis]